MLKVGLASILEGNFGGCGAQCPPGMGGAGGGKGGGGCNSGGTDGTGGGGPYGGGTGGTNVGGKRSEHGGDVGGNGGA